MGQKASRPSVKELSECPLWSLPQELQDLIFAYAYANPSTRDSRPLISRRSWNNKRDIDYIWSHYATNPRPNATHSFKRVVDDFLVSKKFFFHAASVWIGSLHWSDLDFATRNLVCDTRLLRQFIKHPCPVDISTFTIKYRTGDIARMESLQTLTIRVDEIMDREIFGKEKCPRSVNLLWKDILVLPIVSDVLSVNKNVRFVHIVTTDRRFGCASKWKENRFLQSADKARRLLPFKGPMPIPFKALTAMIHTCQPLYQGSRVCGLCSHGKRFLPLRSDTSPRPTRIKPRTFEDLPESMEGMRELVDDHRDAAAEWLWKLRQEKLMMLKDAQKE